MIACPRDKRELYRLQPQLWEGAQSEAVPESQWGPSVTPADQNKVMRPAERAPRRTAGRYVTRCTQARRAEGPRGVRRRLCAVGIRRARRAHSRTRQVSLYEVRAQR